MILTPNQPYPDLPAWEDIDGILTNDWNVNINGLFLRAFTAGNTVDVMGRLHIGTNRIAGILPERFRSPTSQGLTALIMQGPSCIVEIWGGGEIVMSSYSLGLSQAQMIATYQGKQLFFSGSYPRKSHD